MIVRFDHILTRSYRAISSWIFFCFRRLASIELQNVCKLHLITKISLKVIFNVKGPCNVISVDWRKLADTLPFYNVAAANSKPVGYLTADLVNFLVTIPLKLSPLISFKRHLRQIRS